MKGKLEILQVTPFYPPHIGGAEKYVYNLTKKLRLYGNKVAVMTSYFSPKLLGSENHILLPIMYKVGGDWGEIPICPTIFFELTRMKPDIIHVHTPPRFFAESTVLHHFLCKRGGLSGTPLVITYHLHNEGLFGFKNAILHLHNTFVMKSVFGRANMIIALTNKYKEIVCNTFDVEPEKVCVIPNAVDDEFFNSENYSIDDCKETFGIHDENIVLFLGRLASYKGLDYLLESLKMMKQNLSNILLLLVGEGGYERRLRDLCVKLGVQSQVRFLGRLDDVDIPRILCLAKLLVLPSLTESFPTVLLEAFAMGKPVVATEVGGIPEVVINGQTGIIVQRRNSRQLAEALLLLLSDRKLLLKMGTNGKRIVKERYSWNVVADNVLNLYNSLV